MAKRSPRQGASTRRTASAPRRTARRARPPAGGPGTAEAGPLQYKVVELSTVDEASLERAVNEWTRQGWALENVQFAMRESSRRPSMAFVFFTREGAPAEVDTEEARRRLLRLSEEGPTAEVARGGSAAGPVPPPVSAWERLRQLAEGGDDEGSDGP